MLIKISFVWLNKIIEIKIALLWSWFFMRSVFYSVFVVCFFFIVVFFSSLGVFWAAFISLLYNLLSFWHHSETHFLLGVLFWMKTFCSDWQYFLLFFAEFELLMFHNIIVKILEKNVPAELVKKLPPGYLPNRFLHTLHLFLIWGKVKLFDFLKKMTRIKLFVHR